MSRNLFRQSLLWLVLSASTLPADATPSSAISYSEAPVRLLRDTSLLIASRGARLQDGDIIDSGAGPIQLEGVGGATVGLGPASRVYVKLGGGTAELTLLAGWLKVQPGAAASATIIHSGALRVDPGGSALIIHALPGKTEMFVETGSPAVAEMQGTKPTRITKLAREQYAVRTTRDPLKVLPRPSKDFLSSMPPAFFDPLIPFNFKGPAPAPKLERKALFAADVAPWLADDPAVFQVLNRRFNPPPKRATSAAPPAKPTQAAPAAPLGNPIY